ncbi:MAG: pilin [Candidatus Harrisonbacteria bacterium]|nr:pilin [Candidatus Harrisonbacteria bacterium]
MRKIITGVLSAACMATPLLAFAVAGFPDIDYNQGEGETPKVFIDILQSVGNWLFTFLLILAVIMILIAAFKYLFSGGGEKVAEANRMLIFAAVAIAVGLLAAGIPWMIRNVILDDDPTPITPEMIEDGRRIIEGYIPAG